MLRPGIFSWYGYKATLSDRLKAVARAGFTSTALWFGKEEESFSDGTLGEMVKLANEFGLFVDNVHAPFDDCNLIWSNDPLERKSIFNCYQDSIRFCANHGISNVVIHISKGEDPHPMCDSGLELLSQLLRMAEKEDVTIAIENTRIPAYFDFVFSNLESKNLGFCYDSSHDALYGCPSLEILKKWGQFLVTLHLSDNQGTADDHWLPGKGIVKWDELIALLKKFKYSGNIILEVYPESTEKEDELVFLDKAFAIAHNVQKHLEGKTNVSLLSDA